MGTKPVGSRHPPAACRAVPAGSPPPCRTRPPRCCPGRGNRSAGAPGTRSPSAGRPHTAWHRERCLPTASAAACPPPTPRAAAGLAQKLLRPLPTEKSLRAARWGPSAAGSGREPGSSPATAGDFLGQPDASRRVGPTAEPPNQLHPGGTAVLPASRRRGAVAPSSDPQGSHGRVKPYTRYLPPLRPGTLPTGSAPTVPPSLRERAALVACRDDVPACVALPPAPRRAGEALKYSLRSDLALGSTAVPRLPEPRQLPLAFDPPLAQRKHRAEQGTPNTRLRVTSPRSRTTRSFTPTFQITDTTAGLPQPTERQAGRAQPFPAAQRLALLPKGLRRNSPDCRHSPQRFPAPVPARPHTSAASFSCPPATTTAPSPGSRRHRKGVERAGFLGGGLRTWVTSGCSRAAEPLPTQRTAKRRHRQHRSTMRLSALCLFRVSDSTGQI